MFEFFAIVFLASTALMVGFALFLGFLEHRNPSPPSGRAPAEPVVKPKPTL